MVRAVVDNLSIVTWVLSLPSEFGGFFGYIGSPILLVQSSKFKVKREDQIFQIVSRPSDSFLQTFVFEFK